MTTNGVLLPENAVRLKQAGLSRVTISLDTLKPELYMKITGLDVLPKVLEGIDKSISAGLTPVKINTVVVPGQNNDEVPAFVDLAYERGLDVRFIERMPIPVTTSKTDCGWQSTEYVPTAEVKAIVEEKWGPLTKLGDDGKPNGPATMYRLGDRSGRVGFISPMSEPFCRKCGRIRLTADGNPSGQVLHSACMLSAHPPNEKRSPLR